MPNFTGYRGVKGSITYFNHLGISHILRFSSQSLSCKRQKWKVVTLTNVFSLTDRGRDRDRDRDRYDRKRYRDDSPDNRGIDKRHRHSDDKKDRERSLEKLDDDNRKRPRYTMHHVWFMCVRCDFCSRNLHQLRFPRWINSFNYCHDQVCSCVRIVFNFRALLHLKKLFVFSLKCMCFIPDIQCSK